MSPSRRLWCCSGLAQSLCGNCPWPQNATTSGLKPIPDSDHNPLARRVFVCAAWMRCLQRQPSYGRLPNLAGPDLQGGQRRPKAANDSGRFGAVVFFFLCTAAGYICCLCYARARAACPLRRSGKAAGSARRGEQRRSNPLKEPPLTGGEDLFIFRKRMHFGGFLLGRERRLFPSAERVDLPSFEKQLPLTSPCANSRRR